MLPIVYVTHCPSPEISWPLMVRHFESSSTVRAFLVVMVFPGHYSSGILHS
jgi:hypothetical protein